MKVYSDFKGSYVRFGVSKDVSWPAGTEFIVVVRDDEITLKKIAMQN